MNENEIKKIIENDDLIEYCGNLYEFIGMLGKYYCFSNTNNGDTLSLSKASLSSSRVSYVTREEYNNIREEYLRSIDNASRI